MPPSTKISVRVPPELEAMVHSHLAQGATLSDIVRQALQQYLCPETTSPTLSDTAIARIDRELQALWTAVRQMQGSLAPAPLSDELSRTCPTPHESRGTRRRRILALLQAHPEGLHARAIKAQLGLAKNLGDTLKGMERDGLVQRVGYGRYALR